MLIYVVDNTLKVLPEKQYAMGDHFPVNDLWPSSGNWIVRVRMDLTIQLSFVKVTHRGECRDRRVQCEGVTPCWLRLGQLASITDEGQELRRGVGR